ncbi:MAG TPA: FdhF/YdeP family oxidoreductase [Dehalococcoidia bacterium]|nr:FdhF/YdeP family oxidoreductase [Dehalococcoidia bacterium]
MAKVRSGGGWPAVWYTFQTARRVGFLGFWRGLRSKNSCRTCSLGMGGQRGGMVNESGRFPEVCKKSMQALAADMRSPMSISDMRARSFDDLGTFSSRQLETLGRLTTPLYAGPDSTHYEPVSWDAALDAIGDRLRATQPERSFFYVSGRSSNEAGFLLQLFARIYGTNNVNNCSYYCHQASGVGLTKAIGTGTSTVTLDDVQSCDLFFLIGGNPASNHPRLMRNLLDLRRRGGKVVIINPAREGGLARFSVPSDVRSLLFGSEIASQYIQPHIGGDIPLLTGIAKGTVELGAVNPSFIESSTEGSEEYLAALETLSWEEIESASGVSRDEIREAAATYASARSAIFGWTMGITQHLHGVENVRAIANLALLRGMIGRPGAGLLPIRGHSNVQGIGSVGVTPALKEAVLQALESRLGVTVPSAKGLDTINAMHAADRSEIDFALCLGGNLYAATPDSTFSSRALGNVGTVVYLSTALNLGHVHGRGRETYILPVVPRDEEPQPTTQESMFNYVRLSDGGRMRYAGPLSEVQVISEIATRVLDAGSPIDFQAMRRHASIRDAIAQVVPGYEAIGSIDETKQEFHVGGRILHKREFPTPTRRAAFALPDFPSLVRPDPDQLRLMTIRSEGQFNTVVYEEEDPYRGQERRDVLLLNPSDIARLGLAIDQAVFVSSDVGELGPVLVRPFDIREGNAAMYYPEANALVSRDADPQSGTPAFKSTLVRVSIQPAAALQPTASVLAAS